MKAAILVGGRGERLSEETVYRPKPMVEIGGRPLLWHIMMHYHAYGFSDFAIALGYKGNVVRQWFSDHARTPISDWNVDLVDTGPDTNTGGRIKALEHVLGRNRFFLTWGDGVSDVDLHALLAFHQSHGRLATVTAVRPPPRFGHLQLEDNRVIDFKEKPRNTREWINGAFFVLEPEVFDLISGPETPFEGTPLETLAREGELMAYKHHGFWQCMDTLKDKQRLEDLWNNGDAPWATWT